MWDHFVSRKRGKKGEKNGKGLRHFSMKVCEKVQKKGVTTYNEVADELVAEFSSSDNHMSPNDAVSAAVEPRFSVCENRAYSTALINVAVIFYPTLLTIHLKKKSILARV